MAHNPSVWCTSPTQSLILSVLITVVSLCTLFNAIHVNLCFHSPKMTFIMISPCEGQQQSLLSTGTLVLACGVCVFLDHLFV